jgi:mRNA interferase HigB
MRVISRKTLREFWARHAEAEQPLLAWFREAEGAEWQGPADVKARYSSASFHLVFIRFIGTHADYDRIEAGEA